MQASCALRENTKGDLHFVPTLCFISFGEVVRREREGPSATLLPPAWEPVPFAPLVPLTASHLFSEKACEFLEIESEVD